MSSFFHVAKIIDLSLVQTLLMGYDNKKKSSSVISCFMSSVFPVCAASKMMQLQRVIVKMVFPFFLVDKISSYIKCNAYGDHH